MPLIRPAAALLMISLCGGAHDFSEMGRRRVLFAHRDLTRVTYIQSIIYIYIYTREMYTSNSLSVRTQSVVYIQYCDDTGPQLCADSPLPWAHARYINEAASADTVFVPREPMLIYQLYTRSDLSPNVEFRIFDDHHRLFNDLSYRFRYLDFRGALCLF